MYMHKGQRLFLTDEIQIEGHKFPPGFFNDADARAQWGITEVDDPVYPNPEFYSWVETNGELVVTPLPLDFCQAKVIAKLVAIRTQKMTQGGYKVGDHWFHSDLFSRSQHVGLGRQAEKNIAKNAAPEAPMVDDDGMTISPWRTMSGEFVQLSNADGIALADAAASSDRKIFAAYLAKEEEVKKLDTVDALAAYVTETGWPITYPDTVTVVAI